MSCRGGGTINLPTLVFSGGLLPDLFRGGGYRFLAFWNSPRRC